MGGIDALIEGLERGEILPLPSKGGPTVFDAAGRPTIAKVRYTHDAMIDLIIENPWISQNELAAHFGYSPSWISTVIAADAFQERLIARKDELIDPRIRATVEERFRGLVIRSIEVLQEKLSFPAHQVDGNLCLKTLDTAARALGYGAKAAVNVNVAPQFIVQIPEKAASSREWAEMHRVLPSDQGSPTANVPRSVEIEDAILSIPPLLGAGGALGSGQDPPPFPDPIGFPASFTQET